MNAVKSLIDSNLNCLEVARTNHRAVIVDAADQDRSTSADPFDIRDHADWIEPILELDLPALRSEIQRHVKQRQ